MSKIKEAYYYVAFLAIYNEVNLYVSHTPLRKTTNKKGSINSNKLKNIFLDFDNNDAKTEKTNSC